MKSKAGKKKKPGFCPRRCDTFPCIGLCRKREGHKGFCYCKKHR